MRLFRNSVHGAVCPGSDGCRLLTHSGFRRPPARRVHRGHLYGGLRHTLRRRLLRQWWHAYRVSRSQEHFETRSDVPDGEKVRDGRRRRPNVRGNVHDDCWQRRRTPRGVRRNASGLPDENGYGEFQGTFTVTGGTGRFRHASGVLRLTAVTSAFSLAATPPAILTGAAFYLVQGTMLSPEKR